MKKPYRPSIFLKASKLVENYKSPFCCNALLCFCYENSNEYALFKKLYKPKNTRDLEVWFGDITELNQLLRIKALKRTARIASKLNVEAAKKGKKK